MMMPSSVPRSSRRFAASVAIGVAVAQALLYVIAIVALQDKVIYHLPNADRNDEYASSPYRTFLQLGDNQRTHAFFKRSSREDEPHDKVPNSERKIVLFAHGNAGAQSDYSAHMGALHSYNIDTLQVEYPGYASAPGIPNEESIRVAMEDAYQWILANGYQEPNITIYGQSLGGGAVVSLLDRHSPGVVALWETFTSLRDLAGQKGVLPFLIRDEFNVEERLRHYNGRVIFIHTRGDFTIPASHTSRNAKAARTSASEVEVQFNFLGHGAIYYTIVSHDVGKFVTGSVD